MEHLFIKRENMSYYIEIIGPTGSGKSTIHRNLIKNDCLYGGTQEGPISRIILQKSSSRYRLLYKVIPSFFQSYIEWKFLRKIYRRKAFWRFINKNPDFLELMHRLKIASSPNKDAEFKKLKKSAELYQLSLMAKKTNEHVILDESFCHKLLMIRWRIDRDLFSFEDYFQIVPTPDIGIHVDAPNAVCICRQQERGYIVTPYLKQQKKIHEDSLKMSNFLESYHDTEIIHVKNTGTIEETVSKVEDELKEFIDL